MTLYRQPDYQTRFEHFGLSVREKKVNIDFQDAGHFRFPIRMRLATFDLHVTPIQMTFRDN